MNNKKRLVHFVVVFCMLMGILLAVPARPVHASGSTWMVNTMTDENDGSCFGDCSLRDAVLLAQPGDTINFASGGVLKLTLGEIVIDESLTIVGPGNYGGLIVSANDSSRHFVIDSGAQVKISGMLLNHGYIDEYADQHRGGSILNSGYLILENMSLFSNVVVEDLGSSAFGLEGGAIYNSGILIINNSFINGNTAENEGGGIFNKTGAQLTLDNVVMQGNTSGGDGGALYVGGSYVKITNSTLSANSANYGGGMALEGNATAIIEKSSISDNDTVYGGGGLSAGWGSSLTISDTTIHGNSATIWGGGIFASSIPQLDINNSAISGNMITNNSKPSYSGAGVYMKASTAVIENSTISGNSGAYAGGGLYLEQDNIAVLKNTTVANNSAGVTGGIEVPSANNTVNLKNSILADNVSLNTSFHDCDAGNSNDVVSQGHNLMETGSCLFASSGDITGQDPLLNPLADNGGSTMTQSLKPGSPAIDGGNDVTCAAYDQRGLARPVGSHCDMGAYEYPYPVVRSSGANDGWILESAESSNKGGTLNKAASTLRLGDDSANRQYRGILSFDTSALPDNAVITSVTLRFKYAGKTGTLPFGTHGDLLVDVCNGAFKGSPALQLGDFKVACGKNNVLTYTAATVNNWFSQSLDVADFPFINRTGVTQFRLRFTIDDNNDSGADFLKIYSGNVPDAASRPQLIIEYYIP